jgi:Zn-dependent protease with chaperone function
MDFFAHQDRAHRNTRRLIVLFCIAVGGIVLSLYFLSRIVMFFAQCSGKQLCVLKWWDPATFVGITIGVAVFVGMLSLVKILSLRRGGATVAAMLGGIPVDRGTKDPKRRILLNVVEEMAIASGIPVPDVFVLESEQGINAFAAGVSPENAAISVSRGCLDHLSRDELQGVIAHEFSHILSGDMRLNIHIMGVLFGIFALTIVGRSVLRGMRRSRGKGAAIVALTGLGLLMVGSIGTFVGRLIQSAVCRQREFLADASAVQFTRNPRGIAGALMKIGGLAGGSLLQTPAAEQASHLFFGQGVKSFLLPGLLASHPPLAERIRRIDPSFEGTFPFLEGPAAGMSGGAELGAKIEGLVTRLASTKSMYVKPEHIIESVGKPSEESLKIAAAIISMMPDELKRAAADRLRAQHLVYAMLLDHDVSERARQWERLARLLRPEELADVEELYRAMEGLNSRLTLPLVELALPSLRANIEDGIERFSNRANVLIAADERVTLFEFIIQWMIEHRVMVEGGSVPRTVYTKMKPLLTDVEVLLSVLAKAGSEGDIKRAQSSFAEGRAMIAEFEGKAPSIELSSEIPLGDLKRSLNRLALASFKLTGHIVDACAHCVICDDRVTVREGELLRVMSLALRSPIPPFLGPDVTR